MATALATAVSDTLAQALPPEAQLSAADIVDWLAPSPKPELGDLAFPCFRLAKTLRQAPPKIAATIAEKLSEIDSPLIVEAKATGPYVNLRLNLGDAAQMVLAPWACENNSPSFGDDERPKVMVEYSQPNTHKAFHVGHMRNVSLGDSLVRVLRSVGHEVVAANYLGDVGAHIAKCLWWYLDHLSDEQRVAPKSHRGEWLGQQYSAASNQLTAWEEIFNEKSTATPAQKEAAKTSHEQARTRMTQILRQLESRDPKMVQIWDETRQWSLDDLDEIYEWCGVTFDRVFYESEVDEPGLALVEEYLQKGIFVEDDGSIGIHNEEIKHMPYFMLRKRDGTSLYSTKDLALAKLKFEEYKVDRSIYVVDMRQSDHFKHVFLTLEKMGFEQAQRCEHVPYEMVELPEGAMSTRKGTVILFEQLRERIIDTLRTQYFAKYEDQWPQEEITSAVRDVALGAIKYGMLARDVNQKIVFDMDAWLKFEGNTGPYLQYVTARTSSILRKAAKLGKTLQTSGNGIQEACVGLEQSSERALVLNLDRLPAVVQQVSQTLRPSVLCTYLFELAKTYNRFQTECDVIHSEGTTLQARLLLVTATRNALVWGLSLLGINAPERM